MLAAESVTWHANKTVVIPGPPGVLAGLEVMRALHEAGAETEAPLVLINWTNEEGARFSPPMMGSGVAMGI